MFYIKFIVIRPILANCTLTLCLLGVVHTHAQKLDLRPSDRI